MTTRLEKTLKRAISSGAKPYIATLTPDGLKVTEKGRRGLTIFQPRHAGSRAICAPCQRPH